MILDRFPRVSLAQLPTALEPMKRLSAYLGGPDIYIKRDDCTGLATGGNKTRKLEFLMADALEKGADTILTIGAVQSNHVRQTAAAAARLGLACHGLLETEVPCTEASYQRSGNVLLDGLFGAQLSLFEKGSDMQTASRALADSLAAAGCKPYIIPVGGSNATGALGYVDCALELSGQLQQQDIQAQHIVHATGSAGTQAGILTGLQLLDLDMAVTGISVSADMATQTGKVRRLCGETAERVGLGHPAPDGSIHVRDQFVGEAYGVPTEAMKEAVELCARLEGILLDPVYSGKAMAGLINMIQNRELGTGDTIVFLHTGGSAGLFAYDWYFNS
ncbi:MAG: D-cysteine desulfhydrase [Xanthomonadales bacterium]|jgi:L-cysteate sulfo-lyase|nr:D-cysteine desulfhydrase [Xanthomonadales bacterium]